MTEIAASRLTANDELVAQLRRAISNSEYGLSGVPLLVKSVIRDGVWRERLIRQTGKLAHFERFTEFVQSAAPEGLGADIKMLRRICTDDPEALDLLDQATQVREGAPEGNQNAAMDKTTNANSISCFEEKATGTTRQNALRRLRKDRLDLHSKVLAGEISPHGAMVEAGFRKKTLTIPSEPEAAARTLLRHLSREQVMELVQLLMQGLEG